MAGKPNANRSRAHGQYARVVGTRGPLATPLDTLKQGSRRPSADGENGRAGDASDWEQILTACEVRTLHATHQQLRSAFHIQLWANDLRAALLSVTASSGRYDPLRGVE